MKDSRKNTKILVVDDSPATIEIIQRNLTEKNYSVYSASNVEKAIRILKSVSVDLVITDYKMPKISGLDLIRYVRENYEDTEIIMITGYATVDGAVQAVKSGAEEYLAKPFTDDELFAAVERVLKKLQMRKKGKGFSSEKELINNNILGESPEIKSILNTIKKISSTTATVLVTGESGTGKELVARAIHYNSSRASAPFVPINCGGIPEGLLESELFGYVKGAFTGATESRAGFFQTADGGSIFLDEIGDTSLSMQVKLLRVLEDKEVCMVGANRSSKVDVRIIAATNKDLIQHVKKGAFREDMFYRLNVITIEIPPLRNRGDDTITLMRFFAEKYSAELGRETPSFSDKALEVLNNYYWPGNVRELENVIQRLIVMTDGDIIEVSDLPSLMRYSLSKETGFDRSLAEVENEYIRNVLNYVNGNKSRAAEILGIDRKTLRAKLKSLE